NGDIASGLSPGDRRGLARRRRLTIGAHHEQDKAHENEREDKQGEIVDERGVVRVHGCWFRRFEATRDSTPGGWKGFANGPYHGARASPRIPAPAAFEVDRSPRRSYTIPP